MFDVVYAQISPSRFRLGTAMVAYHDIRILCDICLYKDTKLWIRMPEIWLENSVKKQLVFWDDKQKSDEFQKIILSKIFDLIGLTLESAISMKNEYMNKKMASQSEENKITLK